MSLGFEENENGNVVRLEGAIDIACAAELKAVLVRALGSGRSLGVSLEAVTYMDVTAVQLLWAAGQEAHRSGVEFCIRGGLPEAIAASLADAGLPSLSAAVSAG